MVFWVGLVVLSTLLVLLLLVRRDERALERDWDLVLSPRGLELFRSIEERVRGEQELTDLAIGEATSVRELGSLDEAVRLLEVGYSVLERFTPGMLQLVASLAAFSRMVSALAPVKPLRPRDFRLAETMSLAYLNGALHQFLVSSAERFRLRAYILGQGFGIVTRALLRSTRRIVEGERHSDREWEQVECVRRDLLTLTDASLESLRVLLAAQARERS
jgi:hypothetical protein